MKHLSNILFVFLPVYLFSILPVPVNGQQRPNILLIFSDDHAYQATSIYGNKLVQTPNIDRIAREGAILTNNFVTNSIAGQAGQHCSPVNTAISTGIN